MRDLKYLLLASLLAFAAARAVAQPCTSAACDVPDATCDPPCADAAAWDASQGCTDDTEVGPADHADLAVLDVMVGPPGEPPTFADPATPSPPAPLCYDPAAGAFVGVYAKIWNVPPPLGEIGLPALSGGVTVDFAFKETNNSADVAEDGTWQDVGSYPMEITDGTGALFPGFAHEQPWSVCWLAGSLPESFLLRARVVWAYDEDDSNNVVHRFYGNPKRSADVALALDLSGSMDNPLGGGFTKLESAQERARYFVDLMEEGDRLGVYGFSTALEDAAAPSVDYVATNGSTTAGFQPVRTAEIFAAAEVDGVSKEAARDAIADATADGCTPLGQGLLRARSQFERCGTRAKAIVALSDGLENAPPFVNNDPPIACRGEPPAPAIDTAATFGGEEIALHAIHFGAGDWGLDELDTLKSAGAYVYTAADDSDLVTVYNAIRNLLDDLVHLEERSKTNDFGVGTPHIVRFDAGTKLATIGLAWPLLDDGTVLELEVRYPPRPWQSLASLRGTTVAASDAYRVYRFHPGGGTTWEMRVVQSGTRIKPTEYSLAVFTDSREARLSVELDHRTFTAGQPLPIYATVRSGGRLRRAHVEAVVRVPTRSFSTTLRQYRGSLLVPAANGDGDAGRVAAIHEQLRRFLKEDTGSEALHVYRDVRLVLRDDGQGGDRQARDGVYSGVLPGSETRVAGDYRVTVTAQGERGEDFVRVAGVGTLAAVGAVDPKRSQVLFKTDDARWTAKVTILATDHYGNALWPGSASKVRVKPLRGELQLGLVDNLDSTYSQVLRLDPGDQPEVEVKVGEVTFLRRPSH